MIGLRSFSPRQAQLVVPRFCPRGSEERAPPPAKPELAEIKRYSFEINQNCRGLIFKRVSANLALPPHVARDGFYISAIARCKELRLTLTSASDPQAQCWVLFTHGLGGCWKFTGKELPQASRVQFWTQDEQKVLNYVDVQNMGKWNCLAAATWGKGRGPDPVDEFELFKANIVNNRLKKDFEQPVGELLLDQKYFNGIGNYLRAEVALCRFPT